MSIKLNVQRQLTPIDTSIKKGYLYKDIGFDLVLRYTDNPELYKDSEKGDLKPIYDAKAIINSTFGLDLRNHLFDTVSETRAFFLGTDLYDGLTTQEPRISIDRLDVIAVIDEQEYDITLSLSVPSLNIQGLSLRGVLNNEGYTFV
jgi:hypothetical protein